MPIQFKSKLSSQVANDTFLDKTIDDLKKGKLSLYKVNVSETDFIDDLQVMVNAINSDLGRDGEVDPLSNTYSSEEIIDNGDDRKVAIGKLDAQVDDNLDTINSHAIILIDHETRISDNETNIATNTSDITTINDSLGQPNGIATLAGDGKVPATQLPSYVDDVEEYADLASFPATGETGKIYVALDTLKTYRWSGTAYVEISPSEVNSVNGKTGIITIDNSDVGLGNVTDDAQLKRSAGDIDSFTQKNTLVPDDIVILEDSEDGFSKKKARVADMLGGGGGSGINHIANPDFDSNVDDWTGDTNIILSQETVAPLRGEGSLKIDKSAIDASTQVFYTDFSVPLADLASIQTISYDYDFSDANYNDGDLKLQIIQDPLGTPVSISLNGDELEGGKSTNYLRFQTDHTIQDYRLQFIWEATTTDAVSLLIDNVIVAPQVIQQGAIVTDWEDDSGLSLQNLGFLEELYKTRRVGSNLEVTGKVTFDGSGASAVVINLDSYSIDLNKINLTGAFTSLGSAVFNDGGGNAFFARVIYHTVSNSIRFRLESTVNAASTTLTKTVPTVIVSGDILDFNFLVPIQGWSSQANMSSSFGGREIIVKGESNSGQSLTTGVTDIPFIVTRDTTSSFSGDVFVAPERGEYDISGSISIVSNTTLSIFAFIDGIGDKRIGFIGANTSVHKFSGTLSLERGQSLSIRSSANVTLSPSSNSHYINIQKRQTPQTQLQSETVAARYTSDSGQAFAGATIGLITYEDKETDTHNIYNTSTSQLVIPLSDYYAIECSVGAQVSIGPSQGIAVIIRKNGIQQKQVYIAGTNTSSFYVPAANIESIYLEKDDVIDFQFFCNGSTSLVTAFGYNIFSITNK